MNSVEVGETAARQGGGNPEPSPAPYYSPFGGRKGQGRCRDLAAEAYGGDATAKGKSRPQTVTGGESRSGTKIRRGVSPVRVRVPPPAVFPSMIDPTTQRRPRFWQGLLLFAALDALILGGWGTVRPADLFLLLQQPASNDGLLLCRLLGVLYLFHALFLILAAWRPTAFGGGARPPAGPAGVVWRLALAAGVGPNARRHERGAWPFWRLTRSGCRCSPASSGPAGAPHTRLFDLFAPSARLVRAGQPRPYSIAPDRVGED